MSSKLLLKICTSVLFAVMLFTFSFNAYVNATDPNDDRFNFGNIENEDGVNELNEHATDIAVVLIASLKYICVSIAIVILIVISMKYMISAPQDRADIKKHAVPFVIGSVVLFGASGIIQIIQSFAKIIND